MEFGLIDSTQLKDVDLSLPAEPERNKSVLPGTRLNTSKLWVGCSKWGRAEWVGKIYPLKTKERDFLQHYAEYYNSVELNATHYKIIGEAGIAAWRKKTGDHDFRFCPKMYKGITHSGKLNDKPFIINEFLRGLRAFGDKLGPIFIQLQERFSPNRRDELFKFLEQLPKDLQFFLELRHAKWFTEKELPSLLSLLGQLNVGFVITDTAGRRDCCHMHLTIPKTFIRFVGNSLHPTDFTRVDEWSQQLNYWFNKGISEVFFMIHTGDETFSPELSKYIISTFNKACGFNLPEIKLIEGTNAGKS